MPLRRCLIVGALAVAAASWSAPPALGQADRDIVAAPDRSNAERRAAQRVARAISVKRKYVRGAAFSSLPPFSNPAAIGRSPLSDFPRHGSTFGILSTGNALRADAPDNSGDRSTRLGSPAIRGARDLTMLRIGLNVPKNATCLSIRFRFLSEEFPEFVDDIYNDAFIAELDKTTWDASGTSSPTIKAPRNFAANTVGDPIRVNSIGDTTVTREEANGTTFDGATRVLRASTPVSKRRHALYLSIFDQGDRQYDSAVFLDELTLDRRTPCVSGAALDD